MRNPKIPSCLAPVRLVDEEHVRLDLRRDYDGLALARIQEPTKRFAKSSVIRCNDPKQTPVQRLV